MDKKAIIFLDYNGTFDDVEEGKGAILFHGLSKLNRVFDDNIQIVVITSARTNDYSIKEDLICTLLHFPKFLQEKFTYLIEEDCKYLSEIKNLNFKKPKTISYRNGTKKDGVEICLKSIANRDATHCIFVGDDEKIDLHMLDADVGNCKKIMLLANRRALSYKTHPIYKLNLNCKDVYEEMQNFIPESCNAFVVKTTPQSYGVGKGFEAVSNWIEKEKTF